MIRTIKILLAALAMSIGGGASAQTSSSSQYLNPGDQIRIVVWRKAEFSGDFAIAANGTIAHPLYREVQVTGVPLSVVEDRLRTFLARYETSPQFVVQPLVKIIVGGEVRNPNILSVPPETTIAQAVALAGGPTERGVLEKVRLVRDRQEIPIDLSRPDSDVATFQIRSGDQIIVGRRGRSSLEFIAPIASTVAAAAALVSIFSR